MKCGVVLSADLRMQSPVYDRHSVGRVGCVTVSNTHVVQSLGGDGVGKPSDEPLRKGKTQSPALW